MPVSEDSELSHLLYCFSKERRSSQLPMSGGGICLDAGAREEERDVFPGME